MEEFDRVGTPSEYLDGPRVEQKQTLLMAYERLSEKASQLKKLEQLSETLNQKFDRTEGLIKNNTEIDGRLKEPIPTREPNLIELFNNLSDEMERSINRIGNQTERVLQMID